MSALLEKQPDRKRIVALLAEDFQVPVEDVAKLYEHERAALANGARITRFLDIFATRHVQEILRKRGVEDLALLEAGRQQRAERHLPMPQLPTCSTAPPDTVEPLRR